jgi:RNA polymerase sigma-70 factor (ECF subfamily)
VGTNVFDQQSVRVYEAGAIARSGRRDVASEVLEITDAALVARARRGDSAAFEGLVRRYFRTAYSIALAIVNNGMDAEDVCQDAFVKALERLDDCRKPDRFAAWLLQIVRNQARNLLNYRRVRAAKPLELVSAASSADPTRDTERGELRGQLEAALGELTEMQRQVVLLHDLEGYKHREIADALGLSEVASRQHLFAARARLRHLLGGRVLKEHTHD